MWDEGENAKVSSADIAGVLKAGLDADQAFVGNQAGGDVKAALAGSAKRIEAVYAYPSEHYDFWRSELPGVDLPWGMFGENLTTEGLMESEINIGDRFRVGSCELMVTQPRMHCFKLAAKFNRDDIINDPDVRRLYLGEDFSM